MNLELSNLMIRLAAAPLAITCALVGSSAQAQAQAPAPTQPQTQPQAQTYPDHPVRLIIPFAPGGSNDIVGRLIGEELAKRLGQPFVVENRGGAGSTIGTALVAKARPDGYTLLLASTPYASNTKMYRKLPYDPAKDFSPVAKLAAAPQLVTIYPGLPVKKLADLIAYGKANPGKLNYVSSGVGSAQHLASELFQSRAGITMTHVPYKGGGAAMTDVAAGHAQMAMGTVLQGVPYVKGNLLRPLAVGGAARQKALPDVPTFDEAGLTGFDGDLWWGILAPAGTPPAIVNTLSKTIGEIMASPDMRAQMDAASATVGYLGPADFGTFIAAETVKWGELITRLGIRADE